MRELDGKDIKDVDEYISFLTSTICAMRQKHIQPSKSFCEDYLTKIKTAINQIDFTNKSK